MSVLNHYRLAETLEEVMAISDPSYWPALRRQWRPLLPGQEGFRTAQKALTTGNVGSFPASQTPYAGIIRTQYGTAVLNHSWALAEGEPGQAFSAWIKKAPALTAWFYFVDVRGRWLLYAVEN